MPSDDIFLKSSKEFKAIIKEGRKFKSPHFVLYTHLQVKERPIKPKLGISISSSSISLAVQRNRIRRIIKECWRKDTPKSWKNSVLVVKKGTDSLKNEQIYREFTNIRDKFLS